MDRGGPAALIASRVRLLGRAIERRPHRHYLGRLFATTASVALGIPIYDTQCGAKFFRRTDALVAALATPFESSWIFDVELLDRLLHGAPTAALLSLDDLEEVPLREWRDVAGSKLRFLEMLRAGVQLAALALRRRKGGHFAGARRGFRPAAATSPAAGTSDDAQENGAASTGV